MAAAARGWRPRGRARGNAGRPRHPRVPPAAGRLTVGEPIGPPPPGAARAAAARVAGIDPWSAGTGSRPRTRRCRRSPRPACGTPSRRATRGASTPSRRRPARSGASGGGPPSPPSASSRRASGMRGRSTVTSASTRTRRTRAAWSAPGTPCSRAGGRRPLAIFTADCVPLIVVDPERPVLGMAHAGWRGTVQGIAGRLVAALVERAGARADRLRAAIGPSIGPCCYEVDEPVVGPLRAAFPSAWERWVRPAAGIDGSPGALVAGPVGGQRRSAGGGRRAAGRDPEPAALHRLPAGPLLLVPEGGPRGAPRHARRARLGPRRGGGVAPGRANPLQYRRA